MKKQIGEIIKEEREKLGISQRELARRVNLDNGTIAKIEKGLVKKPNIETMYRISKELNLDTQEFIRENRLATSEEIRSALNLIDEIELNILYDILTNYKKGDITIEETINLIKSIKI